MGIVSPLPHWHLHLEHPLGARGIVGRDELYLNFFVQVAIPAGLTDQTRLGLDSPSLSFFSCTPIIACTPAMPNIVWMFIPWPWWDDMLRCFFLSFLTCTFTYALFSLLVNCALSSVFELLVSFLLVSNRDVIAIILFERNYPRPPVCGSQPCFEHRSEEPFFCCVLPCLTIKTLKQQKDQKVHASRSHLHLVFLHEKKKWWTHVFMLRNQSTKQKKKLKQCSKKQKAISNSISYALCMKERNKHVKIKNIEENARKKQKKSKEKARKRYKKEGLSTRAHSHRWKTKQKHKGKKKKTQLHNCTTTGRVSTVFPSVQTGYHGPGNTVKQQSAIHCSSHTRPINCKLFLLMNASTPTIYANQAISLLLAFTCEPPFPAAHS